MKTLTTLTCTAIFAITLASPAIAQSNINPNAKYSWSENCGWMNWRDAGQPAGSQGASVGPMFLSGQIWTENAGFIMLGSGAGPYANTSNSDYGVNILPGGTLAGFAWGENIGWVNFGTASALGDNNMHARFDAASGRFRGYAWGENIGWINLDDAMKFVGTLCRADFNEDGIVDLFDYLDFVEAFSGDLDIADFNSDDVIDFFDYLDFVGVFSSGC